MDTTLRAGSRPLNFACEARGFFELGLKSVSVSRPIGVISMVEIRCDLPAEVNEFIRKLVDVNLIDGTSGSYEHCRRCVETGVGSFLEITLRTTRVRIGARERLNS